MSATTTGVLGATSCDRVQLQLMVGERAEAVTNHLAACAECRFFEHLSSRLDGLASAALDANAPLGAALTAAVHAARDAGEPLLGRYRLEALLGCGGQGEVYRAIDLETSDVVAVKLVRAPPGAEHQSASEVRHARRIVHTNVCRVFHTEHHGGLRLIVMEHMPGGSLAERLPVREPRAAIAMFAAICQGVHAAHEAGFLHLDLKPQNVLLRGDGTPAVTDFGLSVEHGGKAAGGTPAYMAPEQRAGGAVDRRTDVYALGRLLAAMVGTPRGRIARVIRRATAERGADRYPDVATLIAATTPRRRRWLAIAGVAAVAAVALVIAIALLVSRPPPRSSRAWRHELWGIDAIPADAVNVALNRDGRVLPRVLAGTPFACARSTRELLDGVTQYSSWEHGFAFPPDEPICVGLAGLAPDGGCGPLEPDARLCEQLDGGGMRVLDERVRDRDRVTVGGRLGQLHEAVPCGERSVTVELDDVYEVVGVRAWHHHSEHVPAAYRIEVDSEGDARRTVYATRVNHAARTRAQFPKDSIGSGESAPVTAEFSAVSTRRIHLVMDSCTMSDLQTGTRGHGWLYEIEVFALPRR